MSKYVLCAAACAAAFLSQPVSAEGTELHIGGYVKLDALYSRWNDGRVPSSLARDLYVPALTPVDPNGTPYEAFDMHAKQTRVYGKAKKTLADGETITAYIETDFISTLSLGGDERIANSYTLGLRRAYFSYRGATVGQDWTTFANIGAFPESVDFLGPSEGCVFVRQALMRYTYGAFAVALENPETTATPYHGGTRISPDDDHVPDLIVRYNYKAHGADLSVAGLLRRLSIEQADNKTSETGYGASFTGKMAVGNDDVRFMFAAGKGIGRYVGINTINDAVLDATSELEPIKVFAGFVAYRHVWSKLLASTLTYSQMNVDNPTELTGVSATKESKSVHLNIVATPDKSLSFGLEYGYGERQIETDHSGNLNRVQVSATYYFES